MRGSGKLRPLLPKRHVEYVPYEGRWNWGGRGFTQMGADVVGGICVRSQRSSACLLAEEARRIRALLWAVELEWTRIHADSRRWARILLGQTPCKASVRLRVFLQKRHVEYVPYRRYV